MFLDGCWCWLVLVWIALFVSKVRVLFCLSWGSGNDDILLPHCWACSGDFPFVLVRGYVAFRIAFAMYSLHTQPGSAVFVTLFCIVCFLQRDTRIAPLTLLDAVMSV
jgi:hypothetical protein